MKSVSSFCIAFLLVFTCTFSAASSDRELRNLDHLIANYLVEESAAQVKIGAKILEQADTKNSLLLDLSATILENNYRTGADYWKDTNAWLLRVLESSNNKRYIPLIKEIRVTTNSVKIKKYADQALSTLYGSNGVVQPFNSYKVNLQEFRKQVTKHNATKDFSEDAIKVVKVGDTLDEVYLKLGNPSSVGIFNYTTRKRGAGTMQLAHVNLVYNGSGEIRLNSVAGVYIVDSLMPYFRVTLSLPESNNTIAQGDSSSDYARQIIELSAKASSGSYGQIRNAIGDLQYAGISDERVYIPIKREIERRLTSVESGTEIEQVAWLIKGLSYSGNLEYEQFFNDILINSDNKKIAKHSNRALENLRIYSSWNPVISKRLEQAPQGFLQVYRVLNMLNAGDIRLQIIGAKIAVSDGVYHENLLVYAVSRLEQVAFHTTDKLEVDLVAWLIRYVSAYGGADEVALFKRLSEEAKSKKVRKYAKKYT